MQRLEKIEKKEKINESKKKESPEQKVKGKAEEYFGEEIIPLIQDKKPFFPIGIMNEDYDVSDKFFSFFSKRSQGYG